MHIVKKWIAETVHAIHKWHKTKTKYPDSIYNIKKIENEMEKLFRNKIIKI